MRRLAVLLLVLCASPVFAQGRGNLFSSKAIAEFGQALTQDTRFGFPRYATAALPTCGATNKGAVAYDTTTNTFKSCAGSAWATIGANGSGTVTANQFVTTRQSVTVSGHAGTCDFNSGAWCAVTLQGGGADTLTFSNPVTGGKYLIELIQPSGSDGTVTWPGTVHWPGGVTPTLTTTDAQVDIASCIWNGTSFFCGLSANYAP